MRLLCILSWEIVLLSPLWSAFDYPAFTAKHAGLGNSYLAATHAGDGFVMNPALSVNNPRLYAALNYVRIFNLKALQYENGMVSFPLKSLAVGFSAENFGNPLYRETSLTVSAGRLFYGEQLAVGVALRWYSIAAKRYGSRGALGVNVGVRYRVSPTLHLAAVIENLNQPAPGGYREEMPQRVQFGLQYQPLDPLVAHLKVQKDSWFSPEVSLGIEYRMTKTLEFYSGYSTLATTPSLGLGLHTGKLEFHYALRYHFELGATQALGISFKS